MHYRILAEAVMFVHFGRILFVAAGLRWHGGGGEWRGSTYRWRGVHVPLPVGAPDDASVDPLADHRGPSST